MRGVTDMMLGRAADADVKLRENGEAVNQMLQQRTRAQLERAEKAGAEMLAAAAADVNSETTPGGVVMKVLEAGVGPYPAANSTVEVHYQALLADGTVFDSSYARRGTTKLPLDGAMVGVQEGALALYGHIKCNLNSILIFIYYLLYYLIVKSSFCTPTSNALDTMTRHTTQHNTIHAMQVCCRCGRGPRPCLWYHRA